MPISSLKEAIRDVPDFPSKGIIFKDITPVLSSPELFKSAIQQMVARLDKFRVDKIVGVDARGFIFGAAMAYEMGVGFVPARKAGKLPWDCVSESYDLEYGSATLELHEDAVSADDEVVIVDDLLATGGTAKAVAKLVEKIGARVQHISFFVELEFLPGRETLEGYSVDSLLQFK